MVHPLVRTVLGASLLSLTAVACAAVPDSEEASGTESAISSDFRAVDVIVTAKKTGHMYEARAYPVDDVNNDGLIEYYAAPTYQVKIIGTNANGVRETRTWEAPRYMPYNNPAGERHEEDYKTVGFVTAGLSSVPRFAVGTYKPDYEVHNRYSPFGGAIVVKGAFYIHAGPENLEEAGWGSAGCVEIIGNFDGFKKDILELSGSRDTGSAAAINEGMSKLVASRKLFVSYEAAARPNLKASFSRQVDPDAIEDHSSLELDLPAIENPLEPISTPAQTDETAAPSTNDGEPTE